MEDAELRYGNVRCDDEPQPAAPVGCSGQGSVALLEDDCEEEVCHLIVRLDGPTLAPKGWAVSGGEFSPVDAADAEAVASGVFEDAELGFNPLELSGPFAGLFVAYQYPADFGGFALVSADSGLPVAAGGIVWSGRGNYWLPTEWNDAADVTCGDEAYMPSERHESDGACNEDEPLPTTAEAIDLVLKSNAAAAFAGRGDFSAFGYLYTPTVGLCSPDVAEFLVVLTRRE
jgi:hypothetical protein